jgi:hypothetical protein
MQHRDKFLNRRVSDETLFGSGALNSLKHPGSPNASLEERIVAGLKARGILRAEARSGTLSQVLPLQKPLLRRHFQRAAAGVIAALAATLIFMLGARAGERNAESWGDSGTGAAAQHGGVEVSSAAQAQLRAAAELYVAALSRIDATDAAVTAEALTTLSAAADQIARLAPESRLALALEIALPTVHVIAPYELAAREQTSNLIWY